MPQATPPPKNYISLQRKIEKWEFFGDSEIYHLFTLLLIRAAWQPQKINGKVLRRGEVLFKIPEIASLTNIDERRIKYILKKLRLSDNVCPIKGVFSLKEGAHYAIVNYDYYQGTPATKAPYIALDVREELSQTLSYKLSYKCPNNGLEIINDMRLKMRSICDVKQSLIDHCIDHIEKELIHFVPENCPTIVLEVVLEVSYKHGITLKDQGLNGGYNYNNIRNIIGGRASAREEEKVDALEKSFSDFWKAFPTQCRGNERKAWMSFIKVIEEGRVTPAKLVKAATEYSKLGKVLRGYGSRANIWLENDYFNDSYPTLPKGKQKVSRGNPQDIEAPSFLQGKDLRGCHTVALVVNLKNSELDGDVIWVESQININCLEIGGHLPDLHRLLGFMPRLKVRQ